VRRALAALALAASGCHYGPPMPQLIDECNTPDVKDQRCVTFHLSGEDALKDALITRVVLIVQYEVSNVEHTQQAESPDGPAAGWPIAVGVVYPLGLQSTASHFFEAYNGTQLIAYGHDTEFPSPGQPWSAMVTMNRPEVSGCFATPAPDASYCGIECPPCALGAQCYVNSNCLSEHCVSQGGGNGSICQP
jgi:hypothetical protein